MAFETPRGDELHRRVKSVLSLVFLIFNEGYTATTGEEWMRSALCDEVPRLDASLKFTHFWLGWNSVRRALRPAGEATVRRSYCRIRIALCGTTRRFNRE